VNLLIIDTAFQRFSDVSVAALLGCMGTYVIWDSQARARPSYIGEGNILERLVLHQNEGRLARPLDGYVAVFEANTWQRAKSRAEILEALLIAIANETDRKPSVNRAKGKLRALDSIFRDHGVVRVNVRGFDPFAPPWAARRLALARVLTIRNRGESGVTLEHDWRLRRRLQSRAAA
jgi:hypothetical protein